MSQINVSYNPEFKPNSGGTICQLSWSVLKSEMEKAFAKQSFEELIGLEVTQLGIKAVFKTVPAVQSKKKSKKK